MVTALGPGPEFDLIRRFLDVQGAATDGVRVGPGDDCAVLDTHGLSVTVDMAVEGVHFRRDWLDPAEVGYRAAAAAISDLAAMAARPLGVLASMALRADDLEYGVEVQRGIAEAAAAAGAAVLGGDLSRTAGPLVVDIVALGDAAYTVRRSGARPGDEVWVTGELGGAAAAVRSWLTGSTPEPAAREAYARPRPRIHEARWLAHERLATAMIDLSDGLAGDAAHIAAASGVRVAVEAAAVPVAEAARGEDGLRLAVAGGEDYELCFTAPAGTVAPRAAEFAERFGVRLTRVGRVEEGGGAVILDEAGRPLPVDGFQHWREAE